MHIAHCCFAPKELDYVPLDIGYCIAQAPEHEHTILVIEPGEDAGKRIRKLKPDAVFFFPVNIIWSRAYNLKPALEHAKNLDCFKGLFSLKITENEAKKSLSFVDCIVSDETAFEHLDKILAGKQVAGVSYKGLPKHQAPDINSLKSPYLTGAMDSFMAKKSQAYIQTSRGCLFGCYYCFRSVKQNLPQYFTASRVLDEMEYLKNRFGIQKFNIIDDCLITTKERLRKLVNGFGQRDLADTELKVMARFDKMDEEVIRLLSRLNVRTVQAGLQTTNPKLQQYMRRKISMEEIRLVAESLRKHDISLNTDIILGLPGDDIKHVEETIDFALSLKPESIQVLQLSINKDTHFSQNMEKYSIKATEGDVPHVYEAKGIDDKYFQAAVEYISNRQASTNWIIHMQEKYRSQYQHEKLKHAVLNKALKLGQGVDGEGRELPVTFDFRELLLDPETAPLLAEEFKKRVAGCKSMHAGGVTMASGIIASQLMSITDRHAFYMRKEPKQHGRRKQIEGPFGNKVIIVDDILNINGMMKLAVRIAKEHDAEVEKAVAILDYQNGGGEQLGCSVKSIFTKTNLIQDKPEPAFKKEESVVYGDYEFTNKGGLACKKDGRILWKKKYGDRMTLPALSDKVYCHARTSVRGALLCYDLDGRLLWKQNTGPNRFPPALHNGKVYTYFNGLRPVDENGHGDVIYIRKPVLMEISDDMLFVLTEDGYAAMLKNELVWEKKLGRKGRHIELQGNEIQAWTEFYVRMDKLTGEITKITQPTS